MNAIHYNSLRDQKCRIEWVDYAKGICIIMVVMMHSTLDYGHAVAGEGWLHHVVAFARPFRMPDFFLLSGIFLSLSINSPLREFIDRKFIHFIYFYWVWLTLQLLLTESALLVQEPGHFVSLFFLAWVEPVNTLWFVHMLAIFYMTTRLLVNVPKLLVFALATGLQISFTLGWIDTGWSVPDRFFDRYVYFFAGYAAAPWIFSFARQIPEWKFAALCLLLLWAVVNGFFTLTNNDAIPGVGLVLGFAGAAAVIAVSCLLATQTWTGWLRYAGVNSIVIYLSFFLPMKIALKLLANSGLIADIGSASLLITVFSVLMPLVFYWLVKDTRAVYLYKRPAFFTVTDNNARRINY